MRDTNSVKKLFARAVKAVAKLQIETQMATTFLRFARSAQILRGKVPSV